MPKIGDREVTLVQPTKQNLKLIEEYNRLRDELTHLDDIEAQLDAVCERMCYLESRK